MALSTSGAGAGAGMGGAAGPWGALAGGILGGLFGSGPSISPEQRRLFNFQMRSAKDLRSYAQGIPGSDPQELQLLAQQRGLLGQQQRATMEGLFANMGGMGSPAPMDLLQNLATQFQGQQSAAAGGLFNQFFQNRRNALLQAAQIAAGAMPSAQPNQQGMDFGPVLGQIGQNWAYQQGLRGLQPRQPSTINRPVTDATRMLRTGPAFGPLGLLRF